MALTADDITIHEIEKYGIGDYLSEDIITPWTRGLSLDLNDDGSVNESGEGTMLYKKYMADEINGKHRMSIIGKISAITLTDTPYEEKSFGYDEDNSSYIKDYQTWQSICSIFTNMGGEYVMPSDSLKVPGYEYYPDDFLYATYNGYPLNRMITLRRFPFPCTDNIWDKKSQPNQDVTRMIAFYDDNVNKLEELLGFSYGLRWKQLQSGYESMQMSGQADNEGLTKFINKAAVAFGDEELIKNRLRGPNGNLIAPDADTNKAHGPVDSITETHIRDVGMDFDKEFSIDFQYTARSFGGRNCDAVMKDILANILMCTFNDGEFWGGARYWIGARPSKSLNMFQWMNSNDVDTIISGAWDTLNQLVQNNFGTPEKAIETLKKVLKGGIQMAMAGIMNAMGRPGVPFANSLLSGSPVGSWHLTIGHPMNPIISIGNLICTGVDIKFPTDVLTYGEFPTTMVATVKLKPAMPLDRAGIEKIFNHGQQRIYMPTIVPVTRGRSNGRHRSLLDKAIDDSFLFVNKISKGAVTRVKASRVPDTLTESIQSACKWVSDKSHEVWVDSETYRNKALQKTEQSGKYIKTGIVNIVEKGKESYENTTDKLSSVVNQVRTDPESFIAKTKSSITSETTELYQEGKDIARNGMSKVMEASETVVEGAKKLGDKTINSIQDISESLSGTNTKTI